MAIDKALSDMTVEQIKKQNDTEPECGHMLADAALCSLLTALGYTDVVREFEKLDKWYA